MKRKKEERKKGMERIYRYEKTRPTKTHTEKDFFSIHDWAMELPNLTHLWRTKAFECSRMYIWLSDLYQ